jgi:hypothetical protein
MSDVQQANLQLQQQRLQQAQLLKNVWQKHWMPRVWHWVSSRA